MPELPTGTVTFLFTDIEGSTRLLDDLGPTQYAAELTGHRRALRDAFAHHGGVEVDTQGDAFFIAFADAGAALAAANAAQQALAQGRIRVRMGLHTGQPHLTDEGYVGSDVHLGARIAAAGHGGQVLMSRSTREGGDSADATLDLGEHRLKDFAAPVWIYQLGNDPFPPLRTISNTNLPRPSSSFVGRDREVADISALLRDGARLLTLTGPGGTGKTRLAIEAASEVLAHFRNGTFWVDLAAVRDEALVAATVGQSIGAKDDLVAHIGEKQMLLVLDNLEQVVGVAPELAGIVAQCPNLRLLTTSRERLRVRDEVEYAVPPLAADDAVTLFCGRSNLPRDATIAELCARLDNLPLAIELAAARTSLLSPAQILERLSKRLDLLKGGRDSEARQQTLRATIEWSYDLLSAEERQLFARLAVFRGGWAVESAESVADADLDVLQSLVDKSLVRHSGERFGMLETIREFAGERFAGTEEAEEIRSRHAEHFQTLAENAEPHLLGVDPRPWLERLENEHDNIRAAIDSLEVAGETQLALGFAGAIWEFWCLRAHYAEGWRRLEHLLAIDEEPTSARAKALTGSAHLADNDPAGIALSRERAQEALALHRELGDKQGIAYAEFQYATTFTQSGDFATARPLVEECLSRFREIGDEHHALQALRSLAWTYEELGDLEQGLALRGQLLTEARLAGDRQMEARALASLAEDATNQGRHSDARNLLYDAYRLDVEFGDPDEIGTDLIRFARAIAYAGRTHAAVQVLAAGDAAQERVGGVRPSYVIRMREEAEAVARAGLDAVAFAEAWQQGRKLAPDEAAELALAAPETTPAHDS